MVKWEYCIERVDGLTQAIGVMSRFQKLGEEGWENYAVIQLSGGAIIHYFKRPKDETK